MKDDLIRREDAISVVNSYRGNCQFEIEDIPAVDEVEVVHAYWKAIGHKSARVCSRCEKDEPYKFADDNADVFDYCPHCGARMDGADKG